MRDRTSTDVTAPTSRKLALAMPFFLYAFGAIFALVGVGLFLFGQSAAADARLLAAEGVVAVATVVDRTATESQSRDKDGRLRSTTSYRVTLTFTSATGEAVTVDQPVSASRFNALRDGQVVEILHVPSRPTLVGFEKGNANAGLGFFGVMAAIFGAIGLGIIWLGVVLRRRLAAAT